jgi:biotin carboxylase
MRIIIDSADKRMTVPIIDALALSGYEVHGLCFDTDKPLNTRNLKKVHYIAREAAAAQLAGILSAYTAEDILIAGNPIIIEAVNALKPGLRYLLPERESIAKAIDKKYLQQLARTLDIKTPKELQKPGFPMIAKLNISENVLLKPADRYRIIRNESQLAAAEPFMARYAGNLILQEYVEGPSIGVSMLLDRQSNLVDFIVHERLLEYPASGGPSAACRSIVNARLAHTAYRLLRELKWQGMAMVEFKGDTLIEINPRFWGSLPLLFIARSDFFGNYIKTLQNNQTVITPDQSPYQPNKIMVYFPQGLLSVACLIKQKKFNKAFSGFGMLILGKEGIFRFKNPQPFFRYIRSLYCQKFRPNFHGN